MTTNLVQKYIYYKQLKNEFGISYASKVLFYKLKRNDEGYIKLVTDYLYNDFAKELVNDNLNIKIQPGVNTNQPIVWSFWWQGVEALPEILKICYQSHIKYIVDEGIEYRFISKDNYRDYVDVPLEILQKVETGIISLTHFSDYLRIALIEKYGGAWIDITLLLTSPIDKKIFKYDFYSLNLMNTHHKPKNVGQLITQCKWAGFMLVSKKANNYLFRFIKISLEEYWRRYNMPIDYFLLNCLFKIGYDNNILFKKMIDDIPINNENLYDLQPILNEKYNTDAINKLKNGTHIFKLTQKKAVIKKNQGITTFYGNLYMQYFD